MFCHACQYVPQHTHGETDTDGNPIFYSTPLRDSGRTFFLPPLPPDLEAACAAEDALFFASFP